MIKNPNILANFLPRLLLGSALSLVPGVLQRQALAETPGPVELPTLSVEGANRGDYRVDQPALSKLTSPLLDTPQSITVLPRQILDDRAVTTLNDALRSVPGISLAAGEGGSQGTNLSLRGFTARNDLFLDGMRDFGSYYRDPFNLESVEVVEGPSAVLFGRGSTGGVVNQVSKTAGKTPFVEGTVALGSDLTRRATVDINQPVADGTALRLNIMGHESEVAERNGARNRRFGFAPTLTLGQGGDTRLTLGYLHQTADDVPDYGVPWLLGSAAPVARSNFYGFKSDYLRTGVDIGTVKLEHDLNDAVTLRSTTRYANYTRDFRITEPQVAGTVTAKTPLSAISVTRNEITGTSTETFLQNQSEATVKFGTGPFAHTLVSGVELSRETSDPTRYRYTGVPATSLLSPNSDDAFAGVAAVSSRAKATTISFGAFALDTVKLAKGWELTAGLRWDRAKTDYSQTIAPATAFSRTDAMVSPRLALVYKPASNGSVYVDYGTSFNPSAEALSISAANASLAPEENETIELGTKWDLFGETLSLRAALFQTEKTNARVPDTADPTLNTLGGDQRVRGFTVDATGRVTADWRISAGYMYLDGRVVKSSPVSTSPIVGAPLVNTPKHSFTLWTTYDVTPKFQLGGGAQYLSSRVARNTAPIESVPGYVTFDAMAKYSLTDHVSLQANLYNIADKYYLDQLHPSHVVPGAGRTILFTTSFKY